MNTKYNISLLAVIFVSALAHAQTMRWIPAPQGPGYGACSNPSGIKMQSFSYVLEYTPAVSGVLTSYTTGFLVSCTSVGSAVVKNQSRVMTSKSREVSGCNTQGVVLMNSSGNTGDPVHNTIQAGVPVILHQICLSIPEGESLTISEDVVTDLSTSIDIGNNQSTAEFPDFETVIVGKVRYDAGKPLALLDFQGIPAGDFISQLDWSTSTNVIPKSYVIERSTDGDVFQPIGEVAGGEKTSQFYAYQFFDKEAHAGDNYYRLTQLDHNGKSSYSAVRKVTFVLYPFTVSVSPNPATEKITLKFQYAKQDGFISILDASGKQRLAVDFEKNQKSLDIALTSIEPGTYTVVVTSGSENHVEKIVLIR